jgi:hypothetical protein
MEANNLKTTNIRFGPGAYSILKNLPGSLVGIFSEFIDNSIASYSKNKEILEKIHGKDFKLKIVIEKFDDEIVITDNAAGINEKDFQRALQPANKPEDTQGLNEFGMGMKYAAVWLSNEWELHSSAIGETVKRRTIFNYDEVTSKGLEELPIYEYTKAQNEHGTKVILRYLETKHVNPFQRKIIVKKLSSIYRNFIRPSGTFQSRFKEFEIDIYFDDEKLEWIEYGFLKQQWYEDRQGDEYISSPLIEWKYYVPKQEIEWTEDIMDRTSAEIKKVNKRLVVSGFVGILPDGDQAHKNGFVITRRGRVIEGYDSRIFPAPISTRQPRSFEFVRIYGELNFDEVEVSFDKSRLSISQEIRDICFSQIANGLRKIQFEELPDKELNLLKQAKEYRAKFTRKEVVKGIEKYHIHHRRDDYEKQELLNEIGNKKLGDLVTSKINIEVQTIHIDNVIPKEFSRQIEICGENWNVKLNWINDETKSQLYFLKQDFEKKVLLIYLNMADSVIVNNKELKEDIHFMDFIFCLSISELKAKMSGAIDVQLLRIAFNDFIKILKG